MSSSQTPLLSVEEPTPSGTSGTSGTCLPHISTDSDISGDSTITSPRFKAQHRRREFTRYVSFFSALLSCTCAGSITVFARYGHIFQTSLHYTQTQVNEVAIAGNFAQYLPMFVLGYACDHIGPGPVSLLASVAFGIGYFLAAFAYQLGADQTATEMATSQDSWSVPLMVCAFMLIGVGTLAMYISAIATCAKNFSRSRYRGIALALPGAAYGLSGTWEAQFGSRVLTETLPNGESGDVDVFKFFIFLGTLLPIIGVTGFFFLKVVDEEELIDEAVEELERSCLLDHPISREISREYGSVAVGNRDVEVEIEDDIKIHLQQKARKKDLLLNEETRLYLKDHTMWLTAAGFLLLSGPGEAFLTNMGTILGTLEPSEKDTVIATHVSIWAALSTGIRIVGAVLTDFLAPTPSSNHFQAEGHPTVDRRRFTISRVTFLIFFGLLFSLGQVLLASGFVQYHKERFWIISLLNGLGYGAYFSLCPILVNTVWGSENFGTNWGLIDMMPAFGATFWGFTYAKIYEWAAEKQHSTPGGERSGDLCHGQLCYGPTFWAISVSVWIGLAMWLLAWKGPNGWSRRGIAI